MDIKDREGLTTKFWQADAILRDPGHAVYGWATFLLPSRTPRRSRLAYKVVLGASAGLYWVFKRETYPHEHVILPSLQEPCLPESESKQNEHVEAIPERKPKVDGKISGLPQAEQAYASEIPETNEPFVKILLETIHHGSSKFDSGSVVDTTLTSSSTRHLRDFSKTDAEFERLSPILLALQVKGEKFMDKPSQVLDWLNLAISEHQENEWPYDALPYEDWQAGVANQPDVVENEVDSGKSEASAPLAEQDIPTPLLTSEREEIDLDSAFGMGATDLEDEDHQAELDVDVSKIIKDSPEFHILIAKLERARQATFVGVRGQVSGQKSRLQPYILGDVVAQASEVFGELPKERWNAEGWAYATGFVKYSYMSAAHEYHSDNGYYQHPRLEALGRSCDLFWASSTEHAQHPHTSLLYHTEEVPSQPGDDTVLVSNSYHHENYLMHPVEDKTSTPPEVSLWVTHLARRKKVIFDPLSRKGVLAAQATKTVDPYQYTGPQDFLNIYSGTQLRNAIVGYVNRVYLPSGSWQYWEYQDEAAPMLPSDVEWFTNAEDGYKGMQPPYFVDPCDGRDMIVNGDCGIHGPPRRSFPFGQKAKAYFCGSPLRYELWNSNNSRDDGTQEMPSVAHMPSIAEEDEDEEAVPPAAHLSSMAETTLGGRNEPVQVHPPATPEEVAPVEQPRESIQCELDGLSEEAISLENYDFYGTWIVAPEHISFSASTDEEIQSNEIVDDDKTPNILETKQGDLSPTHYVHRTITSLVSRYDTSILESENNAIHAHGDDQDRVLTPSDDHSRDGDVEWDNVPLSSETSFSEMFERTLPLESEDDELVIISEGSLPASSFEDYSALDKETNHTDVWPVDRSKTMKDPKAAYLVSFSKDGFKPHRENPMEDYLAKWVDDVADASGTMGYYGYITHDQFLRRFSEDPGMAIQSSVWRGECIKGTGNAGKEKTVERILEDPSHDKDVADCRLAASSGTAIDFDIPIGESAIDTKGDDFLKSTDMSPSQSISQARSSMIDDHTTSTEGTSLPPGSAASRSTTPDYMLDIDLEISILQERLGELHAMKFASQYPTLDQFEQEHLTEEYRPLLPTAGDTTPPAAMVITGILAQASQHPELDEYLQGLTTAMAFKGLRAPTQEPVLINPNDFEGSEEAPIPGYFSIEHPNMLLEAEIAKIAENHAVQESAEAARAAEALKVSQTLTDAELETAAEASELQDLEDNAAINGGQIIFQSVSADVAWQPETRIAPAAPIEAPVVDEEQPTTPVQTPVVVEEELATITAAPVVGHAVTRPSVPTLVYANYSDIMELDSAPAFNEYLYGTADYGISRKVRKWSAKLRFWGRVRSGKLDLGA